MLDPRHKHLGFLTPAQKMASKMKLAELGEAVEIGRAAMAVGDEEPALSDTDEGSANERQLNLFLRFGRPYGRP